MNKPSESDIAKHAYHLWEREGRPHGRDQEHWHTAEREIMGAATAKEDRPIGEIRCAQQASADRTNDPQTSARQTGPATPVRPEHLASPSVTQAAATTSKRGTQMQGEQSSQPSGTRTQQSASGRTAGPKPAPRKPRAGSKQTEP